MYVSDGLINTILLIVRYYLIVCIFNILCSFFFQAEDGIRDLTVTGVQTCALPISGADLPGARRGARLVGRPRRGAEEDVRRLAAEARAVAQGPRARTAVGPVRQSRGAARPGRATRQGRREHDGGGGDAEGVAGGDP